VELALIKDRVVEGDAEAAAAGIQEALTADVPARVILEEALIPGMEEVGDLFARGEYFVPELLLAARTMSRAVELLGPHLAKGGHEPLGKVVMGTVQGDLHDIGKKLVAILLEGNGFEVVDLGSDVAPERFVAAVQESGARLVGLSSLLTTTLPAMAATVRALSEMEVAGGVRVMIGGAPVTDAFAREIGADGYGPDASAAVTLARRLLGLPARAPGAA
jgi:5-methyltetrahydrofolate--homocysteine methyltransferase